MTTSAPTSHSAISTAGVVLVSSELGSDDVVVVVGGVVVVVEDQMQMKTTQGLS
jgi:hypothetical protein